MMGGGTSGTGRWRLDDGDLRDLEVTLRPSTTVGDLALALEDHLGGVAATSGVSSGAAGENARCRLTVGSATSVLDPDRLALDAMPPSGTSIRLVELPAAGPTVEEPVPAPVSLSGPAGRQRLHYGRNEISEGVVVEVGTDVLVVDDAAVPVFVDGVRVRGNTGLRDGAMVRCGAMGMTVRIGGALNPPAPGGPTRLLATSRGEWIEPDPSAVEVPAAPGRFRAPAFPWLTALVPLLMAGAMWVATRSLMMVGFMAFSFVYVLASGLESRREARRADTARVQDFREELSAASGELEELRSRQEHRDEMQSPACAETLDWARLRSHRLWERSGNHPYPLSVRVGRSALPPDDRAVGPEGGRPGLRDEVAAVLEHNAASPRPLTVDLAATGGIAVIGDQHAATALAAALVAQLAMLTPPEILSIEIHSPAERWQWAHWLPHVRPGGRNVLAVYEHAAADPPPRGGHPVIWVAPDTLGLPEHIRALVQIDSEGRASLQFDHAGRIRFEPEVRSTAELEAAARRVAGNRSGDRASADVPTSLSLSDVGIVAEDGAVASRWLRGYEPGAHRSGFHLEATLGRVAGGGLLSLDLVADGPHALVAGTTGAGKSEMLRTMLASLAANHSPERVNFLLVDYKGGAAFGPLAGLPHCVGLVTDLGPGQVVRTLTALRAELHRREVILDTHGASDMAELAGEHRPASLVLAVDEFATLVSEVPEFLDGVLDVAQRGRSLGIHMVLATQRPTGVVSDAVKANTSIRIALRLPDPEDSSDVVGSPAAAELPRHLPGRALVRLGHDTLLTTQVAYSGSPLADPHTLDIRALGEPPLQGPVDAGAPSELAALSDAIRRANDLLGLPAPRRPLPPPLPEVLELDELRRPPSTCTDTSPSTDTSTNTSTNTRTNTDNRVPPKDHGVPTGRFPIGLLDRPEEQLQEPLLVDPLADGGVLVLGAPGSGASGALVTMAAAAEGCGGWEIHAVDTHGGLAALAGNGSVSGVVEIDDHEGVRRLLDRLLAKRTARPTMLLVDGFAAFEERQSPVNRNRATELLVRLANEGRALGVAVVVSARQRTQLPSALLHALGLRVLLRSIDADAAAMMDAPADLADRNLPPGRAWVRGDWLQIARPPVPEADATWPTREHLPTLLPTESIAGALAGARCEHPSRSHEVGLVLPVGIGASTLAPDTIDLTRDHCIVAGPPRSGRSTALATIEASATRLEATCLREDDPRTLLRMLLQACTDKGTATEAGTARKTVSRLASGWLLGLMDDFDDHAEDPEVDELLCQVLTLSRRRPVRLAVAADSRRLARSFGEGVARLRGHRTGLLLGPDAHERGDLLHHELHHRQDIPPAAGRGWLLDRSGARIVQVAC